MKPMPMTVEAAEPLLPPGDEALHRCRAAIGHLLELPAATATLIASETEALDRRAKERLKLARYVGTITSLAVFFFAALLLRDWPAPASIVVSLLMSGTPLPFALRLHRKHHERDREELIESFRSLSAAERIDLANMAGRWPETQAALKRWTSEGRPLTEYEHRAMRRFDFHRSALEDELRAIDALSRATSEPISTPMKPLTAPAPTQVLVQAQAGANVICSAGTVQFQSSETGNRTPT